MRAVLFNGFTFIFFILFLIASAGLFTAIFYAVFYHKDTVDAAHITVQLVLATFVNNFLLVLITYPIIFYGARTGRVSFLEEKALKTGVFWFVPLRIRNVFLRALAIAIYAELVLVGPVLIILWSLCAADDNFCHYRAKPVGLLGILWLLVQNIIFFPLVFAAALNKATVAQNVLVMGLESARRLNAPMRNSSLVTEFRNVS